MSAKKGQRRASRYAELARDRGRRATAPSPVPPRPSAERAPIPVSPRPRTLPQPVRRADPSLVAAELRRISLIGGLMLLLLFGLSRLLG